MFLRCLRLILPAASLTPVVAAPLINEVMYRPGTGVPEPVLEEFIELHNPDAAALDVGGWRFSTGVDFTFPAGSSIPGGGFLVVCANTAAFQARHPGVTGILGNWSGTLANSGETVTLVDALGVVVDEVDYADEGDWATRVREQSFGGWDWATAADGGDRSLELRQPALSNQNGQNWSPSTPAAGTPGAANSTAAANIAPLIRDVQHSPGVPRSTDNIVIDCEIEDESPASLSVTLFWRVSTASPPAFTATPMVGDADGAFTATLGPRPNGTIIEYYVSATDGVLTRTWPAPTDGPNASDRGQLANAQLQVDDEVPPPNEPFYRLVLTAAENSAFQNLANSNPGSNRQFNVTFIASTGGDPDLHHLSAIRIRGASSRSHNPTPLRVSIPRDNRWNGISSFNLNPKYSWLQYIGTKLFLAAGLPANNSIPVHLRRNGVNHARGDNYDFGRWAHIEDINSDYADNHFPLDPNGNLYKKVRPDVGWAYRNGNLGAYEGDGWSKETNSADDDWNDLDSFLGIMNANPGSPGYLPAIESAADVDQWMAWFALETIIANRETNASNGADDDYSMYRGEDDPRFRFLPHDLDTILGEGDTSSNPTHTLFDMTSSGDVLEPLVPFFQVPSIRQRYFQALRKLCQTTFAPARFSQFVDNHLGGWVPAGTLTNMKSWVSQRCSFIESTVAPEIGPLPPPPEPTSISSLTAPHGTVFLNEVLARNLTTTSVGGTFPDVVELRHSGAVAADLSGMSLSDTSEIKDKFVFPPGTSITPADSFSSTAAPAPDPSSVSASSSMPAATSSSSMTPPPTARR